MDFFHKYLYISFFFPPMGGAEPRHNLSTVRRLYSNGFFPTIVTAPEGYPYAKDEYLRSLIPPEIEIIRCNWPYEAQKYIQFARKMVKIPENPLVFSGWKNLYNPARKVLKESSPEFIYSVHGIGAAHLAALKLKKETGLPWVAEFRDPWDNNVIAWNYMKDNSWGWWHNRMLENTRKKMKEVLSQADLIVVESTMHREYLIKNFQVGEEKVVPLGMSYEEEYFRDIKKIPIEFSRRPVIGFVGSVYYGYDYAVESLIRSLKDLEENGSKFTLISLGDSSNTFSKFADEYDLRNFLPISRVDYATALGLMEQLDFGIILGPKSYKLILNSKIWEYLKFNLSILAIVPVDSMAAEVINNGQCGYILDYDQLSMCKELRRVLADYTNGSQKRANPHFIDSFSSRVMVDELAKRINQLL